MPADFAALERARLARGGADLTVAASRYVRPAGRSPAYVRSDYGVVRGDVVIRAQLTPEAARLAAEALTRETGTKHDAHPLKGNGWRNRRWRAK